MATNSSGASEIKEASKAIENFEQLLEMEREKLKKLDEEIDGKLREGFKELDEEIQEAEKKSKAVLCDPGP